MTLDYTDTEAIDANNFVPMILEELFKLHELKGIEVHFTIGEAIVALTAGWDADSVKLLVNIDSFSIAYMTPKRPHLLSMVLDRLIQNTKDTKPSLLKASGVWLFSFVQYCSHVTEVHQRLREAQASFMRLLSAHDDMVQETASRGLTLVYEKGDEALRTQLFEDLVSAFTGNQTRMNVDQDTELFDAGALPTGDGQSVTSYKDIVNVASEVGDQTLIYKFMSLASNAATWSTCSAFGHFGLSNIISNTEVDPKLYPKLYHYRFDPNPNFQRSMNNIWKATVKEPTAILNQHFDLIMEDLLKNIVGKEWRVREASCSAISDLIQGRKYSQYERYYSTLWVVSLKVIDDVKGSVRKAALDLCMVLSKTLIRTLENSSENTSTKAMMGQALEFLLSDKGTDSSIEDVKVFSTVMLLDICKKGGRNLRPYTPRLVPHLLGLLSNIEPDVVGYAYQRVSHDTKERIDKKRAALANRSPLSEAVDECLRFADGPTIEALYPNLEATIKSAIGMPTKIGCGRVLGTLFTRHAMDVKPMSGKLMTLLEAPV
ncbi:Proteasome component ECM29 [Ceratocystis lukuohia]|uniref:Proteasome component ECM29 n=1 Tax=Ceratocystis lukuohia TaxID=2019550 RepID=A0ABR4MFW7_9PEZI